MSDHITAAFADRGFGFYEVSVHDRDGHELFSGRVRDLFDEVVIDNVAVYEAKFERFWDVDVIGHGLTVPSIFEPSHSRYEAVSV